MSYRIPKGSGQRPINDERRLFTPQESKIQKKSWWDQAVGDEINRQPTAIYDGLFAWCHDFQMDA